MNKLKKIILLILIFASGFALGNVVKYYLDMWRAEMSVQTFLNAIEAPYKNDKYGGTTPEETFDMYITALKKGDLELASKYFAINKQKGRLESLKEIEDLDSYIKELESIDMEQWIQKDGVDSMDIGYKAYRYIEQEIETVNNQGQIINKILPVGEYSSVINFKKNNNIWKLYLL